ncbi:MarR family transcriptional regulator [Polaromonas hydrogenivorans]|uniref:MarR family transcriptional regulator n=1 Tax=Polaromonas hydrogenivorans TaxID=335476 RepID=A0AAU7LUD1_9BURK
MEKLHNKTIHIDQMPGHAIRRLHQISVGIAHQEAQALSITPVQYAILQSVHNHPNTDQRTLANLVSLDTSTTAGVVDRLEARGLLTRNASPDDRRVRLLTLTPAGEQLLAEAIPRMERVQELILAPLTPSQRIDFMELLNKLVSTNNELSRAAHSDARKLA